jgi:hypothetical protein
LAQICFTPVIFVPLCFHPQFHFSCNIHLKRNEAKDLILYLHSSDLLYTQNIMPPFRKKKFIVFLDCKKVLKF